MIVKQTYSGAQTDTTLITPSSGKAIYIWQVIIESVNSAEVKFITSQISVAQIDAGKIGLSNVDQQGAVDEVLSITCGADTTVKVLYDEV